jgi:hypothetical protein
MSPNEKIVYMNGFRDALLGSTFGKGKAVSADDFLWAEKSSVEDYIKALDGVYQEQTNVRIPISVLVNMYVTPKFKGKESQAKLQIILDALRNATARME